MEPDPQHVVNPSCSSSGADGFDVCPFGLRIAMRLASVKSKALPLAVPESTVVVP